jgi:hypothetical protein
MGQKGGGMVPPHSETPDQQQQKHQQQQEGVRKQQQQQQQQQQGLEDLEVQAVMGPGFNPCSPSSLFATQVRLLDMGWGKRDNGGRGEGGRRAKRVGGMHLGGVATLPWMGRRGREGGHMGLQRVMQQERSASRTTTCWCRTMYYACFGCRNHMERWKVAGGISACTALPCAPTHPSFPQLIHAGSLPNLIQPLIGLCCCW